MTPQEKYTKAIASRPSNADLKYWASLDTKATEIQKTAFDADLEDRSEQFREWLAEYDRKKVCQSNVGFETWNEEFLESIRLMSSLDSELVPLECAWDCYRRNEQAGIAALNYVQFHEPQLPDPEMVAQQMLAREWMENMAEADKVHTERLKQL